MIELNSKKGILVIMFFLSITLITGFKINSSCSSNKEIVKPQKSKIDGLYILKSCEKSRFKINIYKVGKINMFSIFDRKKIISKGKLYLNNEDGEVIVAFGEIVGLFEKDKIVIQNHGDVVNQYMHFTQCGEKFLTFIKL